MCLHRLATLILCCAALLAASCNSANLQSNPYTKAATTLDGKPILITFAAMGDIPYEPGEEEMLAKQLAELPKDARFVFHVGDIQKGPGTTPVTEARYIQVEAILKKSPIPLFIIPGDNEFNDAPNVPEAWAFWNKHFLRMHENWKYPVPIMRQPERQENIAWVENRVLFMGINLVGGRVHDAAEWRTRHAQCVAWIKQNCEKYKADVNCAVLFAQANPAAIHRDFMAGFLPAAAAFEKPFLFLHGDGHKWIYDHPYAGPRTATNNPPAFVAGAPNILRVQVDMGGIAPPIMVTVTDDPKDPFIFDRRLPPGK